ARTACCAPAASGAASAATPATMKARRSITGEPDSFAPASAWLGWRRSFAVGAVQVDVSAWAPAGRALFSCGASPRGFGVIHDFSFVGSRTGAVPRWVRLQPPPPRTAQTDFPYAALLSACRPGV